MNRFVILLASLFPSVIPPMLNVLGLVGAIGLLLILFVALLRICASVKDAKGQQKCDKDMHSTPRNDEEESEIDDSPMSPIDDWPEGVGLSMRRLDQLSLDLYRSETYYHDFAVVGCAYLEPQERTAAEVLQVGDRLLLHCDPDNTHDPHAVKVTNLDSVKVGYIAQGRHLKSAIYFFALERGLLTMDPTQTSVVVVSTLGESRSFRAKFTPLTATLTD